MNNCQLLLILAIIWNIFIIAGTSYIVFWKGESGWWFLLAILLMVAVSSVVCKSDTKENNNINYRY